MVLLHQNFLVRCTIDGSALTGSVKMIAIAPNTGGNGSALEFDLSMDTSYLYQRFVIEGVWYQMIFIFNLRVIR